MKPVKCVDCKYSASLEKTENIFCNKFGFWKRKNTTIYCFDFEKR